MKVAFAVTIIALVASHQANAQPPASDPVASAPIRIGALGLGPQFSVSNLGIDTNVFNSVTDPKSDFTFTTSPGLRLWLRTARGLLSVDGRADLLYFSTYGNQRGVSTQAAGQYEYRFNKIRPLASFDIRDVRERPGYEIDARVRRYERTLLGGLDLSTGSKSHVQFDYQQTKTTYADDAIFNGQSLDESLNLTRSAVQGTFRHRLTSLTTWLIRASSEQERFEFATERNSNSGRGGIGLELDRLALVRGSVFVGVRSLASAAGGTIPSFLGVTADVDTSYTAPTQTRISVRVARDIQYSYNAVQQYYLQTGIGLTLTQRITGRWDVQVLGGRDRLSYRGASFTSGEERSDYINRLGGGIGYQFAENARASFDVQGYHRLSATINNDYRTLRAGASVTYGY